MRVEFRVAGVPVAWSRAGARAGLSAVGKPFVRHFTRPDQRPYRALLIDAARQASSIAFQGPCASPWRVEIVACYPRPKSHYTSRGALTASSPRSVCSRPDIDNIVKQVLDALNGVLWIDDRQVIAVHAQKVYGSAGELRVVAEVVKHEDGGT